MAKKAKKGGTKKKASGKAAECERKPQGGRPWLGDQAPWEEYCGLQVPMLGDIAEDGETEIVRILDIEGGRIKVIEPRSAVREDDTFDLGSNEHTRTVFSQSNTGSVLMDEDLKVTAMENSYRFFRENSSYKAVIKAFRNFVIGKGVKLRARDENPIVQEYLDEFSKLNKMDGKDAEIVLRWFKTGEIAIRWFKTDDKGRTAKVPKIRFIPFWRINSIKKDPEDDEKDLSYDIQINTSGDLGADTVSKILTPEEVSFWRNADPDEARGEPPFLVIMRSCTWYSDWLKNRVILNRFRTAHVLFKKIIGGTPGKVSSLSSQHPDAANKKGSGGKVEKRLPKMGTMVVHNDKVEYDWKAPNMQAGDAKEDGRHIKLDIAAGAQVPEFILGDASNSNRASTLVSEDPFIREVEFWQDFFKGVFEEIARIVIEHGIEIGAIPKKSRETIVQESSIFMRRVNKVLGTLNLKEIDSKGNATKTRPINTRTDIDVEYPDPLSKDQLKEVEALQIDQAMGLVSVQTLRIKRGYEHETEERRMEEEATAGADRFERERKKEIEDKDEDEKEDE